MTTVDVDVEVELGVTIIPPAELEDNGAETGGA
jgi:hypothetical protein